MSCIVILWIGTRIVHLGLLKIRASRGTHVRYEWEGNCHRGAKYSARPVFHDLALPSLCGLARRGEAFLVFLPRRCILSPLGTGTNCQLLEAVTEGPLPCSGSCQTGKGCVSSLFRQDQCIPRAKCGLARRREAKNTLKIG